MISSNNAKAQALPLRLPMRTDLHLARKAWHLLMGLFIVLVYSSGISRANGVLLLALFFAWDLTMEVARLRSATLNEKLIKIWGPVMRASEVNRMSAIPHYLLASMIAVAVFPKPVAVLSILFLACGDPLASLFGILYGNKSLRFANGKSLIGTLAGVATCAIITFMYLGSQAVPLGTLLPVTLIGGLAGGLVELLPLEVDDNFTIPVVSGFVMWLAFLAFGL